MDAGLGCGQRSAIHGRYAEHLAGNVAARGGDPAEFDEPHRLPGYFCSRYFRAVATFM